ncbi:MAG: Rrf2 family transcriptional regulator [bacterium]
MKPEDDMREEEAGPGGAKLRAGSMQILALTEAAIRTMVYLAAAGAGRKVPGREICRMQQIRPAWLIKCVRPLVERGLISTVRGVGGGFELSKPPESITLLEIVEAVQGPILFNRCLLAPGACEREPMCPVHPVWKEIRGSAEKILSGWNLRDLARTARARSILTGGEGG